MAFYIFSDESLWLLIQDNKNNPFQLLILSNAYTSTSDTVYTLNYSPTFINKIFIDNSDLIYIVGYVTSGVKKQGYIANSIGSFNCAAVPISTLTSISNIYTSVPLTIATSTLTFLAA